MKNGHSGKPVLVKSTSFRYVIEWELLLLVRMCETALASSERLKEQPLHRYIILLWTSTHKRHTHLKLMFLSVDGYVSSPVVAAKCLTILLEHQYAQNKCSSLPPCRNC